MTSNQLIVTQTFADDITIGTVIGSPHVSVVWALSKTDHTAIFGRTKSGKSKLLFRRLAPLAIRILNDPHCPYSMFVLEPGLGLCDDLRAVIAKNLPQHGRREALSRVYDLSVKDVDHLFRINPAIFDPSGIRPHRRSSKFAAFVNQRAAVIYEMFTREFAQMITDTPHLARVLKTLIKISLYADLPLEYLDRLVDPDDELAEQLVKRVLPLIPRRLASFLTRLRRRLVGRDEGLADSVLNRLDTILDSTSRLIFSSTDADCFNFDTVVTGPFIALLDMQEGDVSQAFTNTLGGLLLNNLVATVRKHPVGSIPKIIAAVDECSHYVGLDVDSCMLSMRRWISFIFSTQDISSLRRGDVDLSAKILSQTNTIFCFAQTADADLDVLVPRICRGNYSFEERIERQQFFDHYEHKPWIKRSRQTGSSDADGQGFQDGSGQTLNQPVLYTQQQRDANRNMVPHQGNTTQHGITGQSTHTTTASETLSDELLTLAHYRIEEHFGDLQTQLDVQREKLKVMISEFDTRQMVAKFPGTKALPVEVVYVPDPCATEAYKEALIEQYLTELRTVHSFYITDAECTEEASEQRLLAYLDQHALPEEPVDGSPPPVGNNGRRHKPAANSANDPARNNRSRNVPLTPAYRPDEYKGNF